jgi:hypothetical protein
MPIGVDLFGVGEVAQQMSITGLMSGQARPAAMEVVDDWVGCAARSLIRFLYEYWAFSAQPPTEPGGHLSVHRALQ